MNHRNRTTIRMMSWMITALLPFPMIIHASPRLELKADSISYHDKTKVSEYHNHVNVIYGRSQFAGRDMLVKHKGSKAPEELTLSGKPVHFSIQHDLSQIQGQAKWRCQSVRP